MIGFGSSKNYGTQIGVVNGRSDDHCNCLSVSRYQSLSPSQASRDWECHFAATTSSDTDSYSFHTTDYNAKECSFKNETFYLSPLVNGGVDENTLDSERDGGDGCNISKLEDLEVRMDLTDDLLHMVFSFLKHIDLCQAAMVCKQWQAASAHEDFWRVLYFENRNISVQQCGCFQHGIDSDTLIPSSHIKITRR